MSLQSPILSIDCRRTWAYTLQGWQKLYLVARKESYDMIIPILGEGKVIPQTAFWLQKKNVSSITIGNGKPTFIVDNLRWWCGFGFGINDYRCRNLLLLCDAGGNSYRHHAFKKNYRALPGNRH
jgi:hypothetical protein